MRHAHPSRFALVARGALLATAFWTGLYAWWVYQNPPSGMVSGIMYWWIRHFYGSLSICFLSLLCSIFTLPSGKRNDAAAE
jgi:hypothetical protein